MATTRLEDGEFLILTFSYSASILWLFNDVLAWYWIFITALSGSPYFSCDSLSSENDAV